MSEIGNKKIELFVDNGIDKYRRSEDTTILDLISVYLDNKGFFVLVDKDYKIIGYLDIDDLDLVGKLIDKLEKNSTLIKKKIKEFMSIDTINFRRDFIDSKEKLIDVVKKLDDSKKNYLPVVREGILIGRVSKEILQEKMKDLY